jgi:hypothetical protein
VQDLSGDPIHHSRASVAPLAFVVGLEVRIVVTAEALGRDPVQFL